jgi:hypothetical protein
MDNHQMIAFAVRGQVGKPLSNGDIKRHVLDMFPAFNPGSLLPNDHASGNKSCCWCVGTAQQIFKKLGRNQYEVLPNKANHLNGDSIEASKRILPRANLKSTSPLQMGKVDHSVLWTEIMNSLEERLKSWRDRIIALRQVDAVLARKDGRSWTDAEVFEGIVLSVLSNSTDWSKVEAARPFLKPLFYDFDLSKYSQLSDTDIETIFVPWFKERRSGSVQLGPSLKRLIETANKLQGHIRQNGSLEAYLRSVFIREGLDAKKLALALGTDGPDKLPGLGIALACEGPQECWF